MSGEPSHLLTLVHGDEKQAGGSEWVRGRGPPGWLPPCDPAAGVFGAEGGGEARG